jgi:potassium/hydrogen antiporter
MLPEPRTTALVLFTVAVLLLVSVVLNRVVGRAGVPGALLFIGVGMVAGSEGLVGIPFDNFTFTFRLGALALALILFDGGLNTPLAAVREGIKPAAVLATLGVVATALLMAMGARLLGMPWQGALLLGAIVASTDAAAVFAVLRGSGIKLKRRVGITLELESGLNDPMAVILTFSLTDAVVSGKTLGPGLILDVLWQLAIGGVVGAAVGYGAALFLTKVRLPATGLYPAVTLAVALLAFGSATLAYGSGFLAVYVAAVLLGSQDIPYRAGLLRSHDALAWISQILVFLMLGLLAYPSRLWDVAPTGIVLALFLAFVARPLATLLCLAPFRYPWRERVYISWVGLRGAVPVILATYPVMANAPGAQRIFDTVFFIVVANTLLPGSTVPLVTRWLGLKGEEPPPPPAVLEVSSLVRLKEKVLAFYIDERSAVAHVAIHELPLPKDAAVMLVVRGDDLVPPRGHTVLLPGDHVYMITRPEDEGLVQVMFGGRHELG